MDLTSTIFNEYLLRTSYELGTLQDSSVGETERMGGRAAGSGALG